MKAKFDRLSLLISQLLFMCKFTYYFSTQICCHAWSMVSHEFCWIYICICHILAQILKILNPPHHFT